ncbi:unnamed protein product [Porites evermanni]|uniref:Uncharacterized protein n=1 Tax=Porites evermanni TaxID=104178 RepID=A0ABN8RN19_9CNID|nr:unnamed protein product [Porites evermanni]
MSERLIGESILVNVPEDNENVWFYHSIANAIIEWSYNVGQHGQSCGSCLYKCPLASKRKKEGQQEEKYSSTRRPRASLAWEISQAQQHGRGNSG